MAHLQVLSVCNITSTWVPNATSIHRDFCKQVFHVGCILWYPSCSTSTKKMLRLLALNQNKLLPESNTCLNGRAHYWLTTSPESFQVQPAMQHVSLHLILVSRSNDMHFGWTSTVEWLHQSRVWKPGQSKLHHLKHPSTMGSR